MTKKELIEISKSMKITGRHALKKAELIEAIMAFEKKQKNKKPVTDIKKDSVKVSKTKTKKKELKGQDTDKHKGKKPDAIEIEKKESFPDITQDSLLKTKKMNMLEGTEEAFIRRSKYDTGTSVRFDEIDEDIFLPTTYMSSRVEILIKNPREIFAYWDIMPDDISKASDQLNQDISELAIVLRVYDVTMVDFKGNNANTYFDIFPDFSNRYFVQVPKSNCDYCVEIGLKSKEGYFSPITRSSTKRTPKDFITHGLKWSKVDLTPIKNAKAKLTRKDYIKPLIKMDSISNKIFSIDKARKMTGNIENISEINRESSHEVGKDKKVDYFGSSTNMEF